MRHATRQLEHTLTRVRGAKEKGATILAGGHRPTGEHFSEGFYMAPTLIEGSDELSASELFGPIITLHRVSGFDEAVELPNASPYGLTAAIWTASVHRGQEFVARVRSEWRR